MGKTRKALETIVEDVIVEKMGEVLKGNIDTLVQRHVQNCVSVGLKTEEERKKEEANLPSLYLKFWGDRPVNKQGLEAAITEKATSIFKEKLENIIEKKVMGESFIDSIVERIQKKQLD